MLISRKIWVLVTIAMASCAAVSGFGLYGLKRVNANVSEIASRSVPAMILVSDMRTNYLGMIPKIYDRAMVTDAATGSALEKSIDAEIQTLIKQVNDYSTRVTSEEDKQALDHAKMGLVSFVGKMRQVNALASAGEPQMALEIIQRDVGPLHQRLSKDFDGLVQHNTRAVNELSTEAEATFTNTLRITLAGALSGLAFIGVMGFVLGRSITQPLSAMQQAIMRTVNELDFTDSVQIVSRDEIGRTLEAYNTLLAKLRSSFSEIQTASSQMVLISAEVDLSAQAIAENSHVQSDASAGMAAAIEELTVSISMVAN